MSGLKFEFAGTFYAIPYLPKKEWGDWMIRDCRCLLVKSCKRACYLDNASCVYGLGNWEARKAFYYQCFPEEAPQEKPSCGNCKNYSPKEEPEKELPKLTQAVFDREDCPSWANWAAVDSDGRAFWYGDKPDIGFGEYAPEGYRGALITKPARFDASDWEHSLIERDKTIFCRAVSWPTWFKYSKTAGKYYVMRSAEKYFIVGTVLAVEKVPYDVVDVKPFFKYPAALVGEKVRALWSEDHEVSMVIAASNRGVTLGGESEERSISSFILSFASCADIPLCSFKEVK